MKFQKYVVTFLTICPGLCCAAHFDPDTPLSLMAPSYTFSIGNKRDLEDMLSTLLAAPNTGKVTLKCDKFEWEEENLWQIGAVFKLAILSKCLLPAALENMKNLTTVNLNIQLDTNNVDADGLIPNVIRLLRKIPNLEHLSLNGAFTDKCIHLLGKYIKKNQNLQSLIIGFFMTSLAVEELTNALRNHPNLRRIEIENANFLENEEKFVDALTTCKELRPPNILLPKKRGFSDFDTILYRVYGGSERIHSATDLT